MSWRQEILDQLKKHSGQTDREITDALRGTAYNQRIVNMTCRSLADKKKIIRQQRSDGKIGNFLPDTVNEEQE